MLRLAHRIITQKCKVMRNNTDGLLDSVARLNRVVSEIGKSAVVIVDNVAEYYQEFARHKLCSEFPFAVPILNKMFVEFVDPLLPEMQVGIYSECEPCSGFLVDLVGRDDVVMFDKISGDSLFGDDATAHWLVNQHVFVHMRGQLGILPFVIHTVIDKEGTAYHGNLAEFDKGAEDSDPHVLGFLRSFLPRTCRTFLLAMSFANCRNVVHRDVTEAEGPAPKWIRRQKTATLQYRVLDINPMKEVLRTEGGIEHNGIKKALHICRGHFATYTADKPLFGNIVGTVWKPAHVRGDIKQGAVVKDYSVSPSD